MALAFGLMVFVYWLYALATDFTAADQLRAWLMTVPGQILVYLWLYTFFIIFVMVYVIYSGMSVKALAMNRRGDLR